MREGEREGGRVRERERVCVRVRVREGEGERERERERETEKYDINKYRNIILKNLQSMKSFTSGKKMKK